MSGAVPSSQDHSKIGVLNGSALATVLAGQLAQSCKRVRACLFLCTLDVRAPENGPARRVIAAIAEAARRGVDVQVLLGTPRDPRFGLLNRVAARYMNERGAVTRTSADLKLHIKFIVVDDFCVVGSHNITHKALSENAELSAVVWDAATAASLTKTFVTLWGTAA